MYIQGARSWPLTLSCCYVGPGEWPGIRPWPYLETVAVPTQAWMTTRQMSPDKAPTVIRVSSLSDFTVQLPSHLAVAGCPAPQDPAVLPLFPLGQLDWEPAGMRWQSGVGSGEKRLCLLDGPDTAPESEDDRGAQAGPGPRPGPVIRAVRLEPGPWPLKRGSTYRQVAEINREVFILCSCTGSGTERFSNSSGPFPGSCQA